jgi:hypothetical protein
LPAKPLLICAADHLAKYIAARNASAEESGDFVAAGGVVVLFERYWPEGGDKVLDAGAYRLAERVWRVLRVGLDWRRSIIWA